MGTWFFFSSFFTPHQFKEELEQRIGLQKALISVLHGSFAVSVKVCTFLPISELQT